jgi:large subunit ribosomal protein L2
MKQNSLKCLIVGKKSISGRNNYGRITVRRRGGGHKRRYRKINFKFLSNFYKVLSSEYDPNRNTDLFCVKCLITGSFDYILAIKGVKVGSVINNHQIMNGGRYSLRDLPPNYLVNNVEFKLEKGGQISRASGSFCKILQKDKKRSLVRIRLPSLEERFVSIDCKATVGVVLNKFKHIKKLTKAGNSRWLGRRPKVRGVAMNPIDHPHGGGEGKSSTGRPSVSPWGRLTIGKPTRSKRHRSNSLIFRRKKQF